MNEQFSVNFTIRLERPLDVFRREVTMFRYHQSDSRGCATRHLLPVHGEDHTLLLSRRACRWHLDLYSSVGGEVAEVGRIFP